MEEAISLSLAQSSRPSTALRTTLKRLLDTDRDMKLKPRSTSPEFAHRAFSSGVDPGRGGEVRFSSYEVFALQLASSLMEHGATQARAVSILRRARPALEPKHAAILKWDQSELFDEERIRKAMRPGSLPVWSTRPVYLLLVSYNAPQKDRRRNEAIEIEVLEQDQLSPSRWPPGTSMTTIELTRMAHILNEALVKTRPSKRGRSSS